MVCLVATVAFSAGYVQAVVVAVADSAPGLAWPKTSVLCWRPLAELGRESLLQITPRPNMAEMKPVPMAQRFMFSPAIGSKLPTMLAHLGISGLGIGRLAGSLARQAGKMVLDQT